MHPSNGPVLTSITAVPISLDKLVGVDRGGEAGASILFAGAVRSTNAEQEVVALEYDAYPEMAAPILREIAEEAVERFGLSLVEAAHRTGLLRVGEISVAILVRSAHRGDAYEGSRYVIEQIKRRLPIWKREVYADGSDRWLDGTPLGRGDHGKGAE